LQQRPTLYLIDGHSYIYRAFYAIRNLSTSKGFPSNAIYGFTKMLIKIVREKKPEYMAIAFDTKGPTHRHKEYEEYKANRPAMPDTLIPQIPYIHRVVEGFRIPILMREGYEADDLIGTLASWGERQGLQVMIVSGDKDMLQLVTPHVMVYDTMKERVFDKSHVQEKFGVGPEGVVEVMGLMGDASDNIPGVPGIGEKTAIRLISEYQTIDNLLAHLDQIKKPKLREMLEVYGDQAQLSRKLATIQRDCPIECGLDDLKFTEADSDELSSIFQELEFTHLHKEFSRRPSTPMDPSTFSLFKDEASLNKFLQRTIEFKSLVLSWLTLEPGKPMVSEITGVFLYIPGKEGGYLPIPKDSEKKKVLLDRLRPVFEARGLEKIGHNLKEGVILFKRLGISIEPLGFDSMVAAYLINPGRSDYSLEALSLNVLGEGWKEEGREDVEEGEKSSLRAFRVWQLFQKLRPELEEMDLISLFSDIEMPLISVLGRMEMHGFKLDSPFLMEMSKELDIQLQGLIEKIYRLAGEKFNINSPKQLQEILFNKLNLTPIKKTKTGFSTNEAVLTQLAFQHELPAEIINYRQLSKLKSTYVDALPQLVHPETGRLHTSLHQTVAATGRLSSSDPNLQNIPIRTEIGRRIREAFIVEKGNVLLSADYNQIELRILAHMSKDQELVQAFRAGEDIHLRTAMEIFSLPANAITGEMRRSAKTVNFGIIYGQGPYGLASQIGVSQQEAKRYIDRYFALYSGVKAFMDKTIKDARENNFVTTLFKRRRYISDLQAQNNAARGFGERIAINTPIQGTAADLIKIAMIQIDRCLMEESLATKMILQVHDELLFEVPESEVGRVQHLVRKEMEGVFPLDVPLKVDLGMGKNWAEAH